nr:hypothetical protein CFP56_45585 [Quercus suber]POF23221.1 hypothetical protein CFP56_77427 [Quercus suber]
MGGCKYGLKKNCKMLLVQATRRKQAKYEPSEAHDATTPAHDATTPSISALSGIEKTLVELANEVRGLGNVVDQVQNTRIYHAAILEALHNDVN